MADTVRITMMGSFLIYINEQRVENPVSKSRKGTALMEFLVLHRGRSVPNPQLLHALWPEHSVSNPENALKTLVSRMRTLLNQMCEGLGGCIVSDRGAYHWQNLPGMKVDLLLLMDLFDRVATEREPEALHDVYRQIMELYTGDLDQTGELAGDLAYSQRLHHQYLASVYSYIELLRKEEKYDEICSVCRTALEVDNFDDRLHIELMKAMISMNRTSDALVQYKHATNLTYRYLGSEPSAEMLAFYRDMSNTWASLKSNLEAIRLELHNSGLESRAFVCDYEMFKAIYSLEMRNLERLGTTMFLGVIMVGDPNASGPDSLRQDSVAAGLIDILRNNLRKGDIITHFSPNVVALLLPTVNYQTGTLVLERIRRLFYQRFPKSDIPFNFRLGLLGKDAFTVAARTQEGTQQGG